MSKSYNIEWSRRIVELFCKKYARATALFFLVYNFSEEDAAHLVSEDQRRWEVFKRCVKAIDNRRKFKNTIKTKKDVKKCVETCAKSVMTDQPGMRTIWEAEPTPD